MYQSFRNTVISIALLYTPACGSGQASGNAGAITRGDGAFMQHNFEKAAAAYQEALVTDSSARQRDRAAIALAALRWRLHGDSAGAMMYLATATGSKRFPMLAALEESRMLRSLHHFDAAAQRARDAMKKSTDTVDMKRTRVAFAAAVVEGALEERLAGRPTGSNVMPLLTDAVAQMDTMVQAMPGSLGPARLLVTAAALTANGPALLRGWTSFYVVGVTDTTHEPLGTPRRVLNRLLPGWTSDTANAARTDSVIIALADSRFFDAAAAIAKTRTGPPVPRISELIAYNDFTRRLLALTNEYYRSTALAKGNAKEWRKQLESAGADLWSQLLWSAAPPRYAFDALTDELDRRFGTMMNVGTTAGYEDLHSGHRVVDERRTVSQYGHGANIRFIELDHMISNGFQSWAWDGRAGHGGWGSKSLIVQVRPQYTDGPLSAWRDATDSVRRREIDAEIASDSLTDLRRAATTPVAFFPSVRARLARADRKALLDSLQASGLRGALLQAAFQAEDARAVLESSIFAHEGRHAIDDAMGTGGSAADKEFRAKLSEIAFAPRPKIALGGIFSETTGDNTPHGKANERVAKELEAWMRAHASEVAMLDAHLPLLPQVALLTDAQLRSAFRSMDPLVRDTP